MQTFMQTQKNALLRKYHALLRANGVSDDEKKALLASYGVGSGRELTVYELTEVCHMLDTRATSPVVAETDRWRKRVIAIVSQYLQLMHYSHTIDEVKAVACRAAGGSDFNQIPTDRLRSIYNAFRHRVNDLQFAKNLQIVNIDTVTAKA